MNKKSNKNDVSIQKSLTQYIVYIYVLFLIGLYPLLFKNGYTDILDFKSSSYLNINIIMFLFLSFLFLTWIPSNYKSIGNLKDNMKSVSLTDWFVLGFGLVLTISWLFSDEMAESFWGTSGRMFGYLAIMFCVLGYFIISRYLKFDQVILWSFLLCGMLVYIIAIFNFFQIDILGMYKFGWQNGSFISTLGNVNSLACYSSIILPIGMTLFCVSKKKLSAWIYGIFCILGFFGMVASSSDSIFCSVIVSFLILFWFLNEVWEVKKYLILAGTFILSLQGITIVHHILINKDDLLVGLARIFALNRKMLIFLPVIILLYLGITICEKKGIEKQVLKKTKTIFFLVVGLIAVTGFLGIVFLNLRYEKVEVVNKFGAIGNYLYFDKWWGSCRGTNWIYSIQVFREFDLKHKFIGEGPASFVYALRNCFNGDVYSLDKKIIDAHNEFFQFLITTGVFGVISYFGIYISSIKRSIKIYKNNQFLIAVIICLISYLVQGMINNPHIYTTPLIFWVIAVGENQLRDASIKQQ
ncbi:O-antigen ligase family protein [Anaerosacchariphilus polymeriproducens]|uniref:O-antigen ligase domain-containing protein n=1 Tax=Anaerosacchariphilus polymeriproducens TaxID=1812858 RepID=A0A371AV84_9FIRM|nr:O-antigen ligase family protein [Anaerosacchariphilus polymeriproducens]RDU23459.1 hypothetical protein DWV06_09660 [Anaerosacchariphilus polymeriproducens]